MNARTGLLAAAFIALVSPAFAACNAPMHLKIGTADPRFGVSQDELLNAVEDAVGAWNLAAHRTVLVIDTVGSGVPVNLVYDQRQETTQHYVQARANIEAITAKARVIVDELKPLQAVLHQAEASYDSQRASFERVREIQTLGGAGAMLRDREASLQTKKQQLDTLNIQVNARIDRYNALIVDANTQLDSLNTSNAAGIELIAGHYAEEDGTKRIDVFQFKDTADLRLVLAHELGHALGVEHNYNPRSVMAPLMVIRDLALSSEDAAGLNTACPVR